MFEKTIRPALLAATVTLLGALSESAAAQPDICPHQTIRETERKIEVGEPLGCSGFQVTPTNFAMQPVRCPSFVLIEPPRHILETTSESFTYAEANGRAENRLLTFSCTRDWFLFIPLGSSCRLVNNEVVATYPSYELKFCSMGAES